MNLGRRRTEGISEWARAVLLICFTAWWALGVAAAKGFWATLFAVLVPPYAFVLFAEWLLWRLS